MRTLLFFAVVSALAGCHPREYLEACSEPGLKAHVIDVDRHPYKRLIYWVGGFLVMRQEPDPEAQVRICNGTERPVKLFTRGRSHVHQEWRGSCQELHDKVSTLRIAPHQAMVRIERVDLDASGPKAQIQWASPDDSNEVRCGYLTLE